MVGLINYSEIYLLKNYQNDLPEDIAKEVEAIIEDIKIVRNNSFGQFYSETLTQKITKQCVELKEKTGKHIQDLIASYQAQEIRKKRKN